MEKILRELLSEDKTILIRRDDLLAALEKKTPDNLIRDLNTMRRAVNLNLGELFYNGENQRQATQDKAREILKSSGLQDIRVDFVIDTFTKALGWDKNPPVNLEKVSDTKDETAPPSQQNSLEQRKLELDKREMELSAWQNQLNQQQSDLDQREQNFQQYQQNAQSQLIAWKNQLNQQQYDHQREQNLQQNQSNFENALKKLNQQKDELAERSRQLNLIEERLNKREVELKWREQKLERMESAGKNNSAKSNFYAPSSDDDRYPSNVNNFDNISPQKSAVSIDKTPTYTQNIRQSPEVKLAPPQNIRQSPEVKLAPTQNISTQVTVTDEFNEMTKMTGQDFRQARQNFIKNRDVRAFKCSNSSARMRTPVPPPIFGEVDEISEGDFLAVKIQGNKFAVFPNVKNYTNNHHEERAMGTVFDSNFVSGQDYRKITVEQPALFEYKSKNIWYNSWTLIIKGKLRLEKIAVPSPAPKSTDEKKKSTEPTPPINVAHEYSSRPAPKPSTAVAPISAETVTADYSKLSTDKFISKYNAIKLKFNSSTPLSFEKVDYALAAFYLAVKVQDEKFLFFPNTSNYSDFDHTEQGMGKVFDSNFVTDNLYQKIIVEQPALFEYKNNSWTLIIKGKLRLENPPPVNQNEPQQPEKEQTASSTFWTDFKKNFLTTEGRLNRWAYFVLELKLIGIFIVGMILSGILIGIPILILGIIGNLSVTIRRLHDLDKSGWWILPMFIPYVGWLFILYIFFAKGTSGNNSYGADPLAKLN